MLRGTIIGNSLTDTSVLSSLNVVRTTQGGEWTLHEVRITPGQLPTLMTSLAPGPWYMHFWDVDTDMLFILFKDKIFMAKLTDPTTWSEAIAHGRALGIPEEQLDFVITD